MHEHWRYSLSHSLSQSISTCPLAHSYSNAPPFTGGEKRVAHCSVARIIVEYDGWPTSRDAITRIIQEFLYLITCDVARPSPRLCPPRKSTGHYWRSQMREIDYCTRTIRNMDNVASNESMLFKDGEDCEDIREALVEL